MAVFKGMATWELVVEMVVGLVQFLLLLGNSYIFLLADPASTYLPITLLLDNVAAVMIPIYVLMALCSAEAKAAAAWRKLRELLYLASSLSGAALILAVLAIEAGTRTVFGCPAWVILCIIALEQFLCVGLLVVVPHD